jgi:acyl-CoA reductase-like NAD-dependent aldehyde dehydrogenase
MQPGNYVLPTLVEIDHTADIVQTELFCPILYIFKYKTLDEAIEMNNNVP